MLALGLLLIAVQAQAPGELPQSLVDARRLADQLRYEEALVEYQRYLTDPNRPIAERARALADLGFIHLVLGDEVNAERRTLEALDLVPELKLPSGTPARQLGYLEDVRRKFAARARLELLARRPDDPPQDVRARLVDPERSTKRVLLRHALSPKGPFYSTLMRCEKDTCQGSIPAPADASAFTAWYYLEALDARGESVAQTAGPVEPLQLSVVGRAAWYKSPWLWGGVGAAAIAAGVVVYALAPPPPRR